MTRKKYKSVFDLLFDLFGQSMNDFMVDKYFIKALLRYELVATRDVVYVVYYLYKNEVTILMEFFKE